MTERAVFTERSLAIITVMFGAAIVANAATTIPADARGNLQIGEIVGAVIMDPTGAAMVPLTPTRTAVVGAVPAGSIMLLSTTEFESGTATGAATDQTILQCRVGYASAGVPMAFSERAAMTEKSLAILTIVWTGVAIVLNTSTAVPAGLRSGMDIGEIVSAWLITAPIANVVTSLTVVAPGAGAPGADSIRLDSANQNQIILDNGGGNLLATDRLVMHVRVGAGIGTQTERSAMTEKGLAMATVVYSGGDQAAGVYIGASSQAIPAAFRANLSIREIISAEIHDYAAGGVTALAVVNVAPTAANEIQADSGTSFIRGAATPGDDIPADDEIWMVCRLTS